MQHWPLPPPPVHPQFIGSSPDECGPVCDVQASVYSLSAFSLALQALPKVLEAAQRPDTKQGTHPPGLGMAVSELVKQLATEVGGWAGA